MGARRFISPIFLFIMGTSVAIQLILLITEDVASTAYIPEILSPTLGGDILTVIAIGLPVLLVEYVLFAVPIAIGLLFVTKAVKSVRYEMNIMNIGREFGSAQIVRRAGAPALFSVASSQMFRSVIRDLLFPAAYTPPAEIAPLFEAGLTLMSALLVVPIALLLFMPTWVLNDAGVVTHLKSDHLELRQCPDTQGVGRWIANMLGGYALLAFPITMFISQFYDPLILPLLGGTVFGTDEIIYRLSVGLLWTIGLPFFVMAFILPVILLNEAMQKRSTVRILRWAQRLGAKMIRKERVQEIKRLGYVYDEEKAATVELYATAANKEIVSTQKTIKTKSKTKAKSTEKDSKSTKKAKKQMSKMKSQKVKK